jgi:Protein of unknown function (DUF1822)
MSTLDRSTHHPIHQPQPGEIWAVNIELATVLDLNPPRARYVAIIRESLAINLDVCTAMLLSTETQYLSEVDLIIPAAISGLEYDILAETWNVGKLKISSLDRRVGNRLSRPIYDLLLLIGDTFTGISADLPSAALIHTLGLKISPKLNFSTDFHQRERIWFQQLNPILIARTEKLVQFAAEIERESHYLTRIQTTLSHWFHQIVDTQWQAVQQLDRSMAMATRSLICNDEVTETIAQLNVCNEEAHRRQLIKKLGSIASGREDALTAILKLVQTTADDETLWTAVVGVRQLDPVHPGAGIRKLQSIDLGITVDFVVNIVPKVNNRFGILLQVYPDQFEACLPANLKLILQDGQGNNLIEVVSQSEDCCIQLKLSGLRHEIFSVCLELAGVQSIADFVI